MHVRQPWRQQACAGSCPQRRKSSVEEALRLWRFLRTEGCHVSHLALLLLLLHLHLHLFSLSLLVFSFNAEETVLSIVEL